MIHSISNNQNYQYQSTKSGTSTDTTLAKIGKILANAGKEDSQAVEKVSSNEEYSAQDYMEMMQNGKLIPDYAANQSEQAGDMSNIDADSDGTISTDEYETMISQMGIQNALSATDFFKQYDTNEDGEISMDEMPEPGTAGTDSIGTSSLLSSALTEEEDAFSEFDTNGDGVISVDEFSAMMEELKSETQTQRTSGERQAGDISNIDADSDGTISTDEYETMISQMGIQNALSAEDFFKQYDTNEDGEISLDEMPEPGSVMGSQPANQEAAGIQTTVDESTSEYDTNGDGVLSSQEYAAMMEALNPRNEEVSDNSATAEFQKMIVHALQAYENNYESMFDQAEGSVLNNQA